ncbi:MAG TPA: hypothetical protein VGO90_06070, partial [Chthoniobacteraceae bacterium]|nr:hypothetical protein [Chthoniobacteraceae bacterium]
MNFSPELLPALAERIGWALLHSLWQGAIVTVLLCFALRLLRGRSAAARHAMCLLALLAITAGAAVTLLRAPRAVTRPAASFQMPTAPDPTRPLRMESRASSDFAAISVSLPAELGTRTPTLTPTTWRGWLQLS